MFKKFTPNELLIVCVLLCGAALSFKQVLPTLNQLTLASSPLKAAPVQASTAANLETEKTGNFAEDYNSKIGSTDTAPLNNFAQNSKSLHVPILMYHHVGSVPDGADATRRFLTVSSVDFETQLLWLQQQNYNSVTLEQIFTAAKGGTALPSKPVAITFDDGYSDVFDNAVPLLVKHGFKGSFGIITGYVASSSDYATWDQIKTAQKAGMEIVSHTYSHFDAQSPKYTAEYITQNLNQSKDTLENQLGIKESILIYPYGHYTWQEIQIAKSLGYEMGLTVHYGLYTNPDNLFEVPRVRVSGGESLDRFIEYITGNFKKTEPAVTTTQ